MLELLRSLRPYLRIHFWKVLGSIFFGLVVAAVKGYQVYLVKDVFDAVLTPEASFGQALLIAGLMLASGIVNFPARFFHFYWIRYVVSDITCDIRLRIYRKFQKLPMSFYSKSKQGELLSRIQNDTGVFSQGFRNIVDLIREPLTGMIMLGLAFYRDWQLSLVLFLVLPFFVLIFIISGKKVRETQKVVQEEVAAMTHTIQEGLAGQKIAKAFNLQNYVYGRFRKCQDLFFRAQMKSTLVEELAHPFVEFVGAFAFSGVIVFAHHRISSGAITTGDFIAFCAALALVMDPIRKYSQANVKLNQSRAAGDRLFELLNMPEEIDAGEIELKSFSDKIEVKNLTFSYGEGDVVRNLSLEIKKGQKVALVGLSGSGKSTLINLLLGLYPISQGEIKVDGISLDKIKLHSLRNIFGLVSQDIFLFHDTILENLSVGNEYSALELQRALEVAYASEFISKLNQGEMTIIGDRGTRLSGGQQQRLTIARAFLRDPEVLLFDEATSALDNESEKVVQRALEQLAGDKTVVAVAHRLSTIQEYDQIFVLHEGYLVEQGTHQQLMDKGGEYAKLYELSQKV